MTSDINDQLDNNHMVGACLIDIEKAFDSVWLDGLIYLLKNTNFPKPLLYVIWDMITGRNFITSDGKNYSTKLFKITEGLAQGTVNSPILFNLFTHKILQIHNRPNSDTQSIAFADDLIVYVASDDPQHIQTKLQTAANEINNFYLLWNLRISPTKCETILFHKPLRFLGNRKRELIRDFKIKIKDTTIPHKQTVKYLGVQLDHLLRLNEHISKQITKANNAWKAHCRLFFSKKLDHRAKIICYLLLIRPIVTYATPIWWNTSASQMERLRKFERRCLRAALHIYRHTDEPTHMVGNKTLYQTANIPRIDNFIIQLTRDYLNKLPNSTNTIIKKLAEPPNIDRTHQATSGYIPPQAFTHFDKKGIIQNSTNTPIIYHIRRNQANKSLPTSYEEIDERNTVYSKAIPDRDENDFARICGKYWWITNDDKHIDEIRRRKRHKESRQRQQRNGHANFGHR